MIRIEELMSIDSSDLQEASKALDKNDLAQLVEWLSQKDDKIRYQALLILKKRSEYSGDVYPFWDNFVEKLRSTNSYQRSVGLMLISDNTKWDTENRLDMTIDDYMALLNDEKPITIRQCIIAMNSIIPYKSNLHERIAKRLMSIDILAIKETMRKLILFDILCILLEIRKYKTTSEIESYIINAISGEILDKKTKKQIESML